MLGIVDQQLEQDRPAGTDDKIDPSRKGVLAAEYPFAAGVELGRIGQGLDLSVIITQVYFSFCIRLEMKADGMAGL